MSLSFSHRLYYRLRPYLPETLRRTLRGWRMRQTRNAFETVWPINEAAAHKPVEWPGWPNGKRFAVVLTHDVEGITGLGRCQQLMQLEQDLGFRSCFNFIPEGAYPDPASLRKCLERNGFEVGVHDLSHDGALYSSRDSFKDSALKINSYLRKWDAVGFRSGFMHHNLEWLHDLDVSYDCSTFDTDPFEPQPDGVNTIFPFWVARPEKWGSKGTGELSRSAGYIELPYTLPQDSTLFLLLGEESPDIWKRKVDWIAAHSGMVLLNTHPDYMNFEGKAQSRTEFPSHFYEQLLCYIKDKYEGQYHHALPREIAEYSSGIRPQRAQSKPRRVCMVSYSFYESDNRVMRYATALAGRGDEVDVIALNYHGEREPVEKLHGVTVHRIQDRWRDERGQLGYLVRMMRFLLKVIWTLAQWHKQQRYDLIHVHNIPDFLVFSAIWPRMNGARLILDIHDLLPEFYGSKFSGVSSSVARSLLKGAEWASARFADHVIISNHLWYKTLTDRSASTEKCSVFINHADASVFRRREPSQFSQHPVVIYPGGLQWHQGLDLAIRAFAKLLGRIPTAKFHIYGDGPVKRELVELVEALHLKESVLFFDSLPTKEIAQIMAKADLGVVAKRADSFGGEAYSTKIMEFMSVGIPVVASRTKIDSYYFNDSVVHFFESGNVDALENAMFEVLTDRALRDRLVNCGAEYARQHSWGNCQHDYLRLVDHLCESN